jgi:hypothetical protein
MLLAGRKRNMNGVTQCIHNRMNFRGLPAPARSYLLILGIIYVPFFAPAPD